MKIVKSRNFYIVLVVIVVVLLAVFSLRVLNTTSISETESETNQAETTNESVDTVSSTMVIGSEDAPVFSGSAYAIADTEGVYASLLALLVVVYAVYRLGYIAYGHSIVRNQ